MIRHLISSFFFIIFLFAQSSFAQKVIVHAFIESKQPKQNNDTIYYDFNRVLSWNDFKGTPDKNYFGGAVTASGFAFDSQMHSDGKTIYLDIGVFTFFSKSESWKKPEINSDYHLLHEQHHFDITRIGAQKFISEIEKAHFRRDNYSNLLKSIFNKAYDENEAIQSQYDRETNHSLIVNKQLEWNNKIAAEIQMIKENVAIKN